MPKITYLAPDGTTHIQEVAVGQSVMRGAFDNNVPGIFAECGGACACATCQVFVDEAWADKVPGPGPMEQSMIDEPRRLSCQITVTEALDGLVVRIAEDQR